MNGIKRRFATLINDKMLLSNFVGFLVLFFISILNYLEEPVLEWILRSAIYLLGLDFAFFIGRKGVWLTWCLIAYVMFYFSAFRNVSYFSMIVFLAVLYPKYKIVMFVAYAVNVFILSYLHELEIMKIAFHVFSCIFVYFTMQEVIKRVRKEPPRKLSLTDDEKIILSYMQKGLKQNDIIEFAPETVSRKLKKAKIRNEIKTTKELLDRYIRECG